MKVSELFPHQESAKRLWSNEFIPLAELADLWGCNDCDDLEIIAALTGLVQYVEEREERFLNLSLDECITELTFFVVMQLPPHMMYLLNHSDFEEECQ